MATDAIDLVRAVRDRINAACERAMKGAPMITVLDVTAHEHDACEAAVRENLKDRGEPPIPFVDADGYLLFKNVGLRIVGEAR